MAVKLTIAACEVPAIIRPGDRLFSVLRRLPRLRERDIVAISSKVVAICEGRVVNGPLSRKRKDALIKLEADSYLPRGKWGMLTQKFSAFSLAAGIDEFDGWYVLLPKSPKRTAERIRNYLRKRFKLQNLGVVITDSHTVPLRRGKLGYALGWAGFEPLRHYRGQRNVVGRVMKRTQANIADAVAGSAVLAMGEGGERTPLAVVSGIGRDVFKKSEINSRNTTFEVPVEQDIFGPLLAGARWRRGSKAPKNRLF